jgi:L-lactate dehydrogenase (cytochrome)
VSGLLHPGWTWAFARAEPIAFANVAGRSVGDGSDPVRLADYINGQFDPAISWRDVEWFQQHWSGPIVLKGIQTLEDAHLAVRSGVQAIALSNHGGRQLDGAPAPFELLPSVADAVGDRIEIYCDGGVRRGSDVVKAVALGARACMIGRAYLYGLAVGGERGVDHVLAHLRDGIHQTMALTGRPTLADLGPDCVRRLGDGGDPEGRSAERA